MEIALDLTSIIAELKTEQERLSRAIAALLEGTGVVRRGRPPKDTKKGGMTPAGRRRVSLAMKQRWAAKRTKTAPAKVAASKKRGGLTPAGRKKLAEAMRKRWAEGKMKRS
jgi:hypothetical protein